MASPSMLESITLQLFANIEPNLGPKIYSTSPLEFVDDKFLDVIMLSSL